MSSNKTVLGIGENIEGVLCYLFGPISGLVFLVLERENKFIRFHALQSLVTFLAIWVAQFIIGLIPFLGGMLGGLLQLASIALAVILMFKAYKGETYRLPIVGDVVFAQVNK